jgi:hypothetical protein
LPLSLHVRRAGQATRVWEGREKAVATTPPWQLLPDVRRGLRLSSARPLQVLRGPDFIDSVKGSQNALPRCQSDYKSQVLLIVAPPRGIFGPKPTSLDSWFGGWKGLPEGAVFMWATFYRA